MGPNWLPGGNTNTRSVSQGRPFLSSKLTKASPTPKSVMAASTSKPCLGRMVCAVAATAF